MQQKILLGIFIATFLHWLNYSFFLGLTIGVLGVLYIEYEYIMDYLKKKHLDEQITLTSIQQHVEEILHPIKQKRKHYINRFNNELQVENTLPKQEEKETHQINVIKLSRKKYLKRLETYSEFLEDLKESGQLHGQSLGELESKLQAENEITTIHKYNEGNHDVVVQLTGIAMNQKNFLYLPPWKDYKKVFKFIGACHIEVAKVINLSIYEQLTVLKREYTKEIEEFRKQRRKLKHSTVECYQHFQKVMNEFNGNEKELQSSTTSHNEMLKRKDDPASIIKSEMRVKLQMQTQDNIRSKLKDARERIKEGQIEINEFNAKLHKFQKQFEEQRIVYLKQCFQTSLVGFEDLAHKIQVQITSLIVIMDEDYCQIFPQKIAKNPLSPQKTFTQMLQTGEIGEMSIHEQVKECQRQTEYLINQWATVQKYNEELEYFFKDLIVIFTQYTVEKDQSTMKKQLDQEKSMAGETLNIMVSSVLAGTRGIKDASKQIIDQFEKKRQEIAKCRLDMSIGRELEQRAMGELKKLQQLDTDEKALEQYQNEALQGSKTKKAAQHFLTEMKQNIKDVSSFNLGKFAATVGQTVTKVQKMSNLKEDDMKEQQVKLSEEKKNLISLLGYTLKTMEDILNKHNKLVSRMKKQMIDDLGRYAIYLNSHLRLIIDEMTENIQIILQREKLESQGDLDVIQKEQEEAVAPVEESVEDVHINTTETLVEKLIKVLYNDWKESEYFKGKIKKMLLRTFNKKRAAMLSEIEVVEFKIIGDPPSIQNIQPLKQDINEFLCDLDVSFRGKIQFVLNTNIVINWPKEYLVPVQVKVTISTFTSRIRLCFVPTYMGKSWLSMIGKPVVNLDIEPTFLQKYNIAKIQQIADLIREFLIGKVKLMTYPNKLTVKIPLSKK